KERRLPFLDRAGNISAECAHLARGTVGRERISRVQAFVIKSGHCRTAPSVRAGTRQNFDTPEAEPVKFGRERIVVDTHLADRFFRRKFAARKSVDVYLAAVRTR